MKRRYLQLCTLLTGLATVSSAQATAYEYELITRNNDGSLRFYGINDNDKIVGSYLQNNGTSYETIGFQYVNGSFIRLPSAGTCVWGGGYVPEVTLEIQVIPRDINNLDQITGSTKACGYHRGFFLSGNTYNQVHLHYASSSSAQGINNHGMVVGSSTLPTMHTQAFTYRYNVPLPFNHPQDGVRVSLSKINDAGFMLGGYAQNPWDSNSEFVYDPTTYQFTQFVLPNGNAITNVTNFNDNGQLIGMDITTDSTSGFVYDSNDGFSTLTVPGAIDTVPMDINNHGVVVGHYSSADGNGVFIARPVSAPSPAPFPLPTDDYVPPPLEFNNPAVAELGAEGVRAHSVGDFNHGGTNDIMVAHSEGDVIVYFGENAEEGLFNDAEKLPRPGFWAALVSKIVQADFNNDGHADVVLAASQCDDLASQFPVMLGNGDGSFSLAPCIARTDYTGYIDTYFTGLGVGDVDEDGNEDIVISITGNYGEKGVYMFRGIGDGTFEDRETIFNQGTSLYRPTGLDVTDVNNDGHVDILLLTEASTYAKNNYLFLGDGNGAFTSSSYSDKWPLDLVNIHDPGLDTFADNIVTRENKTVVYPGNDQGEFNYQPQIFDIPPQSGRVVADFNGDSLPDILTIDSQWGINAMATLYTQVKTTTTTPDPQPAPEPLPDPAPQPAPDPVPAPDPGVVDEEPPETELVPPEEAISGVYALSADASDNIGVAKIEFYIDGELVGISTSEPFSVELNSTQYENGEHNAAVVAYDAAGNSGSNSITIEIAN